MGLGAELAMRALNGVYTPSVNPDAYGADANGNIVDNTGKIVPLYQQPNLLQRLVSNTAQQYGDINAQTAAHPALAHQAEAERMFTPTYAGPQIRAKALNDTGANTIVGTLGGNEEIATAKRNNELAQGALKNTPTDVATAGQTSLNNWAIANKIDPLKISLWASQFAAANKREPLIEDAENNRAVIDKATTGAQANPTTLGHTTATIGNQAATGEIQSAGQLASAPYQAFTDKMHSIADANASKWAPPLSAIGIPVNENGMVGDVQRVPGGLNPAMANYAAMSGMFGPGGITAGLAGQQPNIANTSAGKWTTTVPAAPTMHAVLPAGYEHQPQNKAPDYFNHAEDYHQSESHPNLLINPKTNRVVDSQSGEDVTDQLLTDPNLKGLASQLGQEIKEHKESIAKSVFDPHIAKRKADIARLKAEMSELEMHKVNSGLIGSYAEQGAPESYYKNPVFGIPIAAGQADAYMRANTPAQHKGNLYNDLKGMGEQAYQSLFGE